MSPLTPLPQTAPPRRLLAVLLGTALLAGLQALFIYFLLPELFDDDGWFTKAFLPPIPDAWLILVILPVSAGICWALGEQRLSVAMRLFLMLLFAVFLQHTYSFMEGRVLVPMTEMMIKGGHAPFASQAPEARAGAWDVVADYPALLEAGLLPRYPFATKPPGSFLAYIWTWDFARAFPQLIRGDTPLERIANASVLLWPVLAALALVPVFLLNLLDRPTPHDPEAEPVLEPSAFTAPLCFLATPAFILTASHLDHALFPLLAGLVCWTFGLGLVRGNLLLAAASGALLWLACFFTFGLAVLAPLLALVAAANAWQHPSRWRRDLAAAGCFAAGALAAHLAALLLLDYNAAAHFRGAIRAHQEWKGITWDLGNRLRFTWINLLEYSLWISWPMAALYAAGLCRSAAALARRRAAIPDLMILASGAVFVYLAAFAKNAAESGRLWMFLNIFIGLGAARAFAALISGQRLATMSLILIQLVFVLFVKTYMDFF